MPYSILGWALCSAALATSTTKQIASVAIRAQAAKGARGPTLGARQGCHLPRVDATCQHWRRRFTTQCSPPCNLSIIPDVNGGVRTPTDHAGFLDQVFAR